MQVANFACMCNNVSHMFTAIKSINMVYFCILVKLFAKSKVYY